MASGLQKKKQGLEKLSAHNNTQYAHTDRAETPGNNVLIISIYAHIHFAVSFFFADRLYGS
jgi:hypothetical protein